MSKQLDKETIDIPGKKLVPIMIEQLKNGSSVRFLPRGISMLPLIRQGRDSVTLEEIKKPLKRFDIVLYQRDDGKYILHRIVSVGKTITCIGDNQFNYEKNLRHDQMLARVSAFSRGDKQYSVNYVPYRIYCVLWYITRPVRHLFAKVKARIKKSRTV